MDWSTLSSGLTGGVNAIGSIISGVKNNQTQKYLTRLNMDFQREMFDKQVDYNTAMYERQLDDFSPSAIRQRLEDAGINAGMAMSGGQSNSSMASALGVSPPSGVQNPHLENIGNSIAQGVGSFADALGALAQNRTSEKSGNLADAQTRGQNIQNDFFEQTALTRARKLALETKNYEWANKLNAIQFNMLEQTFDARVNREALENMRTQSMIHLYNAQSSLTDVEASLARVNLTWLPQEKKMNLALLASDTSLNYAQAKQAVANALESYARTEGQTISNQVATRTADNIVRQAYWQAEQNKASAIQTFNNRGPSSIWQYDADAAFTMEMAKSTGNFLRDVSIDNNRYINKKRRMRRK